MSQEIERLTNIEQKNFFMRRHQLIQCIRLNAMHLQLTPVPQTLQPDKPEDQDAKPDRTDRNQIHIHPSLALSDLPTTTEDSRLTIYLKRLVHQAPEHASLFSNSGGRNGYPRKTLPRVIDRRLDDAGNKSGKFNVVPSK